ncbi:MAG: porin [Verrucomicrobiota bacterium]
MRSNPIICLAAVSAAFFSPVASAGSNDALLDILVRKGILTESEAAEVSRELETEAQVEKASGETGLRIKAKGKETVGLSFSGRMQGQWDHLGMEEDGVSLPTANHFYFRRLFFGVKAELESGIYAETVLDFAGDDGPEIGFDKAHFGYEFSDRLTAEFGYQKVPFGFEETTSSSKLPTIERSAANRFFADDIDFSARHTGVHASGDLGAGFGYAVALVNAAQGEGSRLLGASNASNDMAVFGRVQWERNGLTLGVDAGGQPNNDVVAQRDPAGNPTVDDFDITAFTGYANYKFEGLNLLGEYFSADMDDAGDAEGYALRASYRVGKFEPVVRYTRLKTDSFEVDSDELIRRAPEGGTLGGTDNEIDSYYLGAAYYFSRAVTFMLGYEFARTENDAGDEVEIDGARARIQVVW